MTAIMSVVSVLLKDPDLSSQASRPHAQTREFRKCLGIIVLQNTYRK